MIDAPLNTVVIECLALLHLPQVLPPAAAQDPERSAEDVDGGIGAEEPFVAHAFDQAASLGERDDEDRAGQHEGGTARFASTVHDVAQVECEIALVGKWWVRLPCEILSSAAISVRVGEG